MEDGRNGRIDTTLEFLMKPETPVAPFPFQQRVPPPYHGEGKWGEVIAERIQQTGMVCRVVDAADYRKAMFEKLIWICAFMLVQFENPVPRPDSPVVVVVVITVALVVVVLTLLFHPQTCRNVTRWVL